MTFTPINQQDQYNPAQGPDIGQPLQAADIESQIRQAFQQQQSLDRAFLGQEQANQKMALQNLNTQFQSENKRAEAQLKQMQELGQFSEMVLGLGKEFGKKYMEDRAAEGKAARLDMDANNWDPKSVEKYNQTMAELKAAGMSADQAAGEALRRTQDYEVAQRYRSLGQYQQVGFAKQHMAEAKVAFPSYLMDQMQSNNSLEIRRPDGSTFTPATASNSAERAAAASVIYKDFVKQQGFAQARDEFVEQFFAGGKGGAREQMTAFLADANKRQGVNDSQRDWVVNTQEINNELDVGNYSVGQDLWNATGLIVDPNSQKPLSFAQRWDKYKSVVKDKIESDPSFDVEKFLETNTDPATGKPLSTRKGLANELRKASVAATSNRWQTVQAQGSNTWMELETQMLETARAQGDGFTYGEYIQMQQQLQGIQGGGGESKALSVMYNQTQQVENRQSNKAILTQAFADGTLTPEMVKEAGFADGSPEGTDLMNKALSTQKATSQMDLPGLKNSINQAIKGVANLSPDAPLSLDTLGLSNRLYSEARALAVKIVRDENMPPEMAQVEAINRLTPQWQSQGFQKGATQGSLAPGVGNNFSNYNSVQRSAAATRGAAAIAARNKFDTDIQQKGLSTFSAGNYIDPTRLQANIEGYYNPDGSLNKNWTPDPLIKQLADANPNETEFTITNKLMKANGLTLDINGQQVTQLPSPPSLFADGSRNQEVDAQTTALLQNGAKLLERARTSNETIRAGLAAGAPSSRIRVPKELTPVFERVSSQTGMRPDLITAIAQTESGLDPNAISPPNADGSKDYGLFQINNQAHPDYRYVQGDVGSNADFAIRQLNYSAARADELGVLPQYREKFILAGYNQGQNSIPVVNGVPQFNAAHRAYIKKVYKQLGGLGKTEVLNDPATMRTTYASIADPVYITGNIGLTSTGQHLDVKRVDRGYFEYNALDNFVEVDDPEFGRVPLSRVPETGDFRSHTVRGSHGRDYGTYSGSKLYLKNGAKVVPELSGPTEHGYYQVIEVPGGQRYSFLHGSLPK